jgi:hypothetical protein
MMLLASLLPRGEGRGGLALALEDRAREPAAAQDASGGRAGKESRERVGVGAHAAGDPPPPY